MPQASGSHHPLVSMAIGAGGFAAGLVLPVLLYVALVGIPVVPPGVQVPEGFGQSFALPGLITWYLVVGGVGPLLPGSELRVGYGLGVLFLLIAQARFFIVWPWVALGVLAWIIVRVILRRRRIRSHA